MRRNFRAAAFPLALVAALVLALASGSGPVSAKPAKGAGMVTLPDGLQYKDLKIGKGRSPKPGLIVTIKYVGSYPDGTVFDSSAQHGGSFSFVIGQDLVMKGWDEGIMSMKAGGKRKLIIPPSLAYGSKGQGTVPPNTTLTFVIQLVKVAKAGGKIPSSSVY